MKHPGPTVCPELIWVWKRLVGQLVVVYQNKQFYSYFYYGQHEVKPWDQIRVFKNGKFYLEDRKGTYSVPEMQFK